MDQVGRSREQLKFPPPRGDSARHDQRPKTYSDKAAFVAAMLHA
jgi:hypothetical protein